jgi:hypothetical protein
MSDFIDQLYKVEQKRKKAKQPGQVVSDDKTRYKIRTKQYCGLSRSAKWQTWLGDVAPDLLEDLQTHLAGKISCKSNTDKMQKIQKILYERGLLRDLVVFLLENYPNIIIKLD